MKRTLCIMLMGLLIATIVSSCKKHDESSIRLAKFANELNVAPDKELSNGTILTGCEYSEGDSLFTYLIKVSDNRFDKLELDSIKSNFEKTVKSKGMRKIVNLLDRANVGLKYQLQLPGKEVSVEFSRSEISNISNANAK